VREGMRESVPFEVVTTMSRACCIEGDGW
jgi:hypothetical protein